MESALRGTGSSAPIWGVEIALMETFGWTERELYEEVTLDMVNKILVYLHIRDKVEKSKAREMERKAKAKRGTYRRF